MATTKKVQPIVVDGYTFPMHSAYIFDLKKVYTTEVARTLDGSIPVFPSKIFVPYFTIKWAILKIEKYHEMMQRIEQDENVVQYYDSFAGEYKTAKFYAQQPTIADFIAIDGDYQYVKDLQLVFAGTLNDTSVVNIEYSANGGSNAPASISGNVGEEFKVDAGTALTRTGYEFVGWNTASDGSGVAYVPSSIRSFATNLTLYAQWQVAEYSRLSLSYGVGKPATDSDGNNITSIQVKYNTSISGLPESVIVWNNTTNAEFVDNNGNPVYTFAGWYTLTNGEGSKINNGSTYLVQGDSSVYAHYNVRSYTITFNSNGGTDFDAISGEYGTKISLPKPYKEGKTFAGWFVDSALTTQFTRTTIPAKNITLYAKYK
jgi:uncharacterized repeat protein (TIGR02543 family)